MTVETAKGPQWQPQTYHITCLQDEVTADQNCHLLLKDFAHYEVACGRQTPQEAGKLAHGADYFLRDFIIGYCRSHIFTFGPEQVYQFGGHWYMLKALHPEFSELNSILKAVKAFAWFCYEHKLRDLSSAQAVAATCDEKAFFEQRLEAFFNLSADDYPAWQQACPCPPPAT